MPDSTRVVKCVHPRSAYTDLGWINAAVGGAPPPFNPAIQSWFILGEQTRERRYWASYPLETEPGWINKATGVLFEARDDYAYYQETQTFRACSRLEAQRRVPPLYTDFPQQGWLDTAPDSLWDPSRYAPVAAETYSFRTPARQPDRHRVWTDEPELSWLRDVLGLYQASFYPAIGGLDDQYRMPPERLTRPILDSGQGTDWIGATLAAAFDPAIQGWRIPGDLYKSRSYWRGDYPGTEWIAANLPAPGAFDPAIQWWGIPADRMASEKAWRPWLDVLDNAWLFTAVPPAFDPAQQSWCIPSGTYEKRAYWRGDYPGIDWNGATFFDPALQSWFYPDVRMSQRLGRPVWWVYDADLGWITVNVPPTLRLLMMTGVGI